MHDALILYPKNSDWAPKSPASLVDTLHDIGLIDKNRADGRRYEFGDKFAHQIGFLGCSPTLYGEDDSTGLFHILLPDSYPAAELVAGDYAKPRCRECIKPIAGWLQYVDNNNIVCPHCGKIEDVSSLHWRRQGAVARTLIIVEGVMEGIAVPTDTLLATLQSVSECDWDYFYYCDSHLWPE